MGIAFYSGEPQLPEFIDSTAMKRSDRIHAIETLKSEILQHFKRNTLLIDIFFTDTSYQSKDYFAGVKKRKWGKYIASHTFSVPEDPELYLQKEGISVLMIIDDFTMSGSIPYYKRDYLAETTEESNVFHTNKQRDKKEHFNLVKAKTTFSFWYVIFDVVNNRPVQYGYVENTDHATGEMTFEDWKQSLIRCVDDVITDGPLKIK